MRTSILRAVAPWLVIAIVGCGDGGGTNPGDGGTSRDGAAGDARGPRVVAAPAPPAEPALPQMTPCPEGWRVVEVDPEVPTCEAWPEGGRATCTGDGAHFPGEPGCRTVGSACPAGPFADDLPAGVPVLYVEPGAADGDGSRGRPFATIDEAFAAAAAGTVVAIAKGTYTTPIAPPAGVTLLGACAGETRITVAEPATGEGAIHVTQPNVTIRNLSIRDGARAAIRAGNGATGLVVEDVVIDGAVLVGLLAVDGATVTARNLVVRRMSDPGGRAGRGIQAQAVAGGPAEIVVERGVIEDTRDAAIVSLGEGAHVSVSRTAAVRTESNTSLGTHGYAALAISGGRVDGTAFVAEHNRAAHLLAHEAGSIISVDHFVGRDIREEASEPEFARGAYASAGARLELRRALFERNAEAGFAAEGAATVLASDVVVRDNQGLPDGRYGMGMHGQGGATITLERGYFARNTSVGVSFTEPGVLTADDVVIRDTRLGTGCCYGRGVHVDGAATVVLRRAKSIGNTNAGAVFEDVGTHVTVEDWTISGTLEGGPEVNITGIGLIVHRGAAVTVDRAVIEDSRNGGVVVSRPETSLTARDLTIRRTRITDLSRIFGRGLQAQYGATVDLERTLIADTEGTGLFVAPEAASVVGRAIHIVSTSSRCEGSECTAGHGVVAYGDAYAMLTDFVVERSSTCGVLLASGAVDLADGEVRENAIGVCLQTTPFDVARLEQNVVFVGNETNLDSTTLPVPDAVDTDGFAR